VNFARKDRCLSERGRVRIAKWGMPLRCVPSKSTTLTGAGSVTRLVNGPCFASDFSWVFECSFDIYRHGSGGNCESISMSECGVWIQQQGIIEGAAKIRSAVTRRAGDAKEEYRRTASQFQAMYQVEMPRRDKEIEQLRIKIAELEAENLRLQEQVSQSRVVRLPITGPGKK
jgi:hypothetical protein